MSKPDDTKCTRCSTKGLDCTFVDQSSTESGRKKKRMGTSSLPFEYTPTFDDEDDGISIQVLPGARTRPLAESSRKRARESDSVTYTSVSARRKAKREAQAHQSASQTPVPAADVAPPVKRRPGRPRKHPLPDEAASKETTATPPPPLPASLPPAEASTSAPRGRGRRSAVNPAVAATKRAGRRAGRTSRSGSDMSVSITPDSTAIRALKSALPPKSEPVAQPTSPTRTEEGSKIGLDEEHDEEVVMPVRSRAGLEKELARAQSISERLQKENQVQREQLNRFATIKLERLASILRNSGEEKRDGHTSRRSLNSTSAASSSQSVQESDGTVAVSREQIATIIDTLAKAISETCPASAYEHPMDVMMHLRFGEHESEAERSEDLKYIHAIIEDVQNDQRKSLDTLRKAFALAQGLQQPAVESGAGGDGETADGHGQTQQMKVDPQPQLPNGHHATDTQ